MTKENKDYLDKLKRLAVNDSSESIFTRFKVYFFDQTTQEQIEVAKGCILNQNCVSVYINDTMTQINYPSLDFFSIDMKSNGYTISFIDKNIKV